MTDLHRAVAARKQLVETIKAMFPGETEETLRDTIDGESNFDETVLSVLRDAIHREAHADAIEGMIDTLASRKRRLAEGAQALRRAARDAMVEGGMFKLTAPDMTVGVHNGKSKVVVTDETAIPDMYCRFKRSVDKTAVGEVLKSGHLIPGAELANGEPVLTIRRS